MNKQERDRLDNWVRLYVSECDTTVFRQIVDELDRLDTICASHIAGLTYRQLENAVSKSLQRLCKSKKLECVNRKYWKSL